MLGDFDQRDVGCLGNEPEDFLAMTLDVKGPPVSTLASWRGAARLAPAANQFNRRRGSDAESRSQIFAKTRRFQNSEFFTLNREPLQSNRVSAELKQGTCNR